MDHHIRAEYPSPMITANRPVGSLLREWRQRRRLSQLDLALEADISTRHISFIETGRSQPSRDMLLRLAKELEIPPREQNALLVAAGFAPRYMQRSLDDAALASARAAIDLVLAGHEPYPALAIDRHWNLVAGNRALAPFFVGVAPSLQKPPINVLRATLHPGGLAPRIANYTQWRNHLLDRLQRQVEATADPLLTDLLAELQTFPIPRAARDADEPDASGEVPGVVVPLRLRTDLGTLVFLYTTTVFGTPLDLNLTELAIESFFPADAATADAMRQMAKNPATR
jgi:transcriptional regulator with XRE-family HTH domain